MTQAGNEAFVKEMAARPFTRKPDALAKAPKPPTVVAVGDTHTITDGARALVLLSRGRQPAQRHDADGLSAAGAAAHRSGCVQPGRHLSPVCRQPARSTSQRLKLRVDRIMPLHGTIQPFSALVAAAKS